jgi:RNase H-like domain found in reverse transcriptase
VEFLGYLLSAEGLTMSEEKVQMIRDWPEPQKVKDIQSFLSFANFYRHFIYNYLDITVPLTWLTQKGIPWAFTEDCQKSFEFLKKAFTSAPIRQNWVPYQHLVVETDTSDCVLGALLSMLDASSELHPVAFHSRMFSSPGLNYDVHKKELLAIFEVFKRWWHYLEGSALPIDVVTDHKNLEYFSTTKLLTQ